MDKSREIVGIARISGLLQHRMEVVSVVIGVSINRSAREVACVLGYVTVDIDEEDLFLETKLLRTLNVSKAPFLQEEHRKLNRYLFVLLDDVTCIRKAKEIKVSNEKTCWMIEGS